MILNNTPAFCWFSGQRPVTEINGLLDQVDRVLAPTSGGTDVATRGDEHCWNKKGDAVRLQSVPAYQVEQRLPFTLHADRSLKALSS
jgi:hypothetical protein